MRKSRLDENLPLVILKNHMHHILASDHGCISRWGRSTLSYYINDTTASVTVVCVGLSDAQFSAIVKTGTSWKGMM